MAHSVPTSQSSLGLCPQTAASHGGREKEIEMTNSKKKAVRKSELKVRVTVDEKCRVQKQAEAEHLRVADYMRYTLLGASACQHILAAEEVARIDGELKRWGNNLIQAQKSINEAEINGTITRAEFKTLFRAIKLLGIEMSKLEKPVSKILGAYK